MLRDRFVVEPAAHDQSAVSEQRLRVRDLCRICFSVEKSTTRMPKVCPPSRHPAVVLQQSGAADLAPRTAL